MDKETNKEPSKKKKETRKELVLDPLVLIDQWAKNPYPKKPTPVFLRKKPEVIIEHVIYWASRLADSKEIAGACGVSVEVLERAVLQKLGITFTQVKERCHGSARISLRRIQYEHAKMHPSMAIWLGKQWLGQKDSDAGQKVAPNDDKLSRLFLMLESAIGD